MTASARAGPSWALVSAKLARLLGGLTDGEVIELAVGDRFFLQVGRVPGAIWLLASGPETREEDLRSLGFHPPNDEMTTWWYEVPLPALLAARRVAAARGIDALRQIDGVRSPLDLLWIGIAAGDRISARAAQLGIPRRTYAS